MIELPYDYSNGSKIYLGDPGLGYPRELYPNLTYVDHGTHIHRVGYESMTLNYNSSLILGPLYLNATSSLISVTLGIVDNSSVV